eukprot:307335-Pelagomonas_calceolata.AAC.5
MSSRGGLLACCPSLLLPPPARQASREREDVDTTFAFALFLCVPGGGVKKGKISTGDQKGYTQNF